jgi:hypothetical protein
VISVISDIPFRQPTPVILCYDREMDDKQMQSDRFKEAAREVDADEDEARWEERLRKVAKHKQEPNSPEHKKVGDETLNPGPDDESGDGSGGKGGDPGRA